MVATPAAAGVTRVEAIPLSSVIAAQLETPPQTERVAPLVVVHPTVAPPMGVTPSEATTCTATGLVAWVPTGVGGFVTCRSKILSVAAAPKVSAARHGPTNNCSTYGKMPTLTSSPLRKHAGNWRRCQRLNN
jgi:hypothetical protein